VKVALARDQHGAPHHLVVVINDISDRKRAQEALISAAADERAHLTRNEFLSRMSHELRTPLNAVQGFAQLLRLDLTQPLSPSQTLKVQQIERAGSRLLAMINDVLDLSRIESGRMKVQVEVISIGELFGEAVAAVQNEAREARVTIGGPDAGAPGPRVLADRGRLQQVLANLLGNAIKFNHAGGEVRIGWQRPAGDPWLVIEVADTGSGMTDEQLAHLFEPFNRLGAERSGVQGTGIGLVVTRRLVELMQGRLTVRSTPGRGTTFYLSLPLVPEEASTAAEPEAAGPKAKRILYAEDNPSNVELLRQVLSLRPQWALSVARNGAEALRAIGAERFDLLLLDMHLGDMTGLELVDAMARLPHAQGVPRIALSADAMPERVQAARSSGIGVYLTKPIDVAALLRCLDDQLAAPG
jgi:signal transduction histidine kinase/CheY-like chemotaxis protein